VHVEYAPQQIVAQQFRISELIEAIESDCAESNTSQIEQQSGAEYDAGQQQK